MFEVESVKVNYNHRWVGAVLIVFSVVLMAVGILRDVGLLVEFPHQDYFLRCAIAYLCGLALWNSHTHGDA